MLSEIYSILFLDLLHFGMTNYSMFILLVFAIRIVASRGH